MPNRYLILAVLAAMLVSLPVTFAQTGLEVMKKNDQQISSNDEKVKITMTLINDKGKTRVRQVERFRITDKNNDRSSLIRFLYPADVKGTGFLEIEHSDKPDDSWLYLPALNKSRRISAANETDNFMSSEFTYEDLGSEKLDQFKYTLKGTEKINNAECFVILAEPASDILLKQSGYSKRILYISKDHYVTMRIDYYDKEGKLHKQLTSENIKQIEGTDKWRAGKLSMKNLQTNYSTLLEFESFTINKGISPDVFTLRNLESVN